MVTKIASAATKTKATLLDMFPFKKMSHFIRDAQR